MTPGLSRNDSIVLSKIFDACPGPLSHGLIDESLPASLPSISPDLLKQLQQQELLIVSPIGGPSPPAEQIQTAIDQLSQIISQHPTYSSAYNNRAQALRLINVDGISYSDEIGNIIWDDLCQAILLAVGDGGRVSTLQAEVLKAAYAQRGHLIWKAAETEPRKNQFLPLELRHLDSVSLKEVAIRDLEMAGRYGDRDAQKVAMSANPYARLCRNIVQEAMKAEIESLSTRNLN